MAPEGWAGLLSFAVGAKQAGRTFECRPSGDIESGHHAASPQVGDEPLIRVFWPPPAWSI